MLGKGWFPDAIGGLDRYFTCLLEHQAESRGVVLGPARGRPDRVEAVSRHDAPLPLRLLAFRGAAVRAAREVDIVDSHFALYAFLPFLSRALRSLPWVVHFQGPWADENVAAGDASRVRRILRRDLERLVYRRAVRIVVLSSAFRRLLVERYRVLPWRIRVESPGVDLVHFSPGDRARARARFDLGGSTFVAVCVRRFVPRMGLEDLVDAWAHAVSSLPPHSHLLLAGEGPLAAEIAERIARQGMQDGIRLLGRLEDDALVDLFRSADVGVVPTRSFEGFGLVVIEAAACGTPTIVTRVGGLPEAVADLDPSLAVPVGDVHALAQRLVQAARAGNLPSEAASRLFAERYSWPAVADRIRAVEREALAPPEPAARMRVVYLGHSAQMSGGEIALLRLVPHLTDVEPHVVLAEDGPFADALVEAGVSTEVLPLHELARNVRRTSITASKLPIGAAVASIVYIARLAVYLRRLRPDLVHTNSLKAGVYGSIAARLAGVPTVWHVRDRIASDYLPRQAVWLARAMIPRLAAAAITNSRATMATLGLRETPAIRAVIPEAIIPPPASPRPPARPLVVGIVGRLAPWKGQDLFLRAFAEAFPDGDQRCVLVGAPLFGEDEYERRLHALAAELRLGPRVEFRGFRADIWPELRRLDILVHASVVPEPFGQVILEAMAARVPVLAAASGGPAELISHDVNGLLYAMGDQSALARAMKRLAGDPEGRRRLVEGAAATVADHHPDELAARVQRVYREVLDS